MLTFTPFATYSAEQARAVLDAWGVADELPRAGRVLLIAFPDQTSVRVTKQSRKRVCQMEIAQEIV